MKASDYYDPLTENIATDRHELFQGRFRKTCKKYGLIIPVERSTHIKATAAINTYAKIFCEKLGLDFYKIWLALNLYDYYTISEQGKLCREGLRKYER